MLSRRWARATPSDGSAASPLSSGPRCASTSDIAPATSVQSVGENDATATIPHIRCRSRGLCVDGEGTLTSAGDDPSCDHPGAAGDFEIRGLDRWDYRLDGISIPHGRCSRVPDSLAKPGVLNHPAEGHPQP